MASKLLYFGTLLLLIFGLWGILAVGRTLQAPFDLSGQWTLRQSNQPPDEEPAHRVSFDQSGRFVSMRIDQGALRSMQWLSQKTRGDQTVVQLSDSHGKVMIRSKGDKTPQYHFDFSGQLHGQWLGQRQPAN